MPSGTAITVAVSVMMHGADDRRLHAGARSPRRELDVFGEPIGEAPDTIDQPLVTTVTSTSSRTKPTISDGERHQRRHDVVLRAPPTGDSGEVGGERCRFGGS